MILLVLRSIDVHRFPEPNAEMAPLPTNYPTSPPASQARGDESVSYRAKVAKDGSHSESGAGHREACIPMCQLSSRVPISTERKRTLS